MMSKGVSAKFMRRFFIAVAIPKMMYAADLFLMPGSRISIGTKGFIGKPAKVQRQASLHITGAMRSAPMDAIDACADLVPFHLLVQSLNYRAATIMVTLPRSHPLAKHIDHTANRYIKSHRAPLHEVMHAAQVRPAVFKSIKPCKEGPKDRLNVMICIPDSKEEAMCHDLFPTLSPI